MGWGNCGQDSKGRDIGYMHEGTCDYPGCNEEIQRGIDHACGAMHGGKTGYCEKYFCHEHLNTGETYRQLCPNCELEYLRCEHELLHCDKMSAEDIAAELEIDQV